MTPATPASPPGAEVLITPEVASYLGMIDALRVLQDRIAGAAPSTELTAEVSRTLTDLAVRLGEYAVDEPGQIAGQLELPGRAQALVPVVYLDEQDEQHAAGRVTFGRLYLGRPGPRTAARSRWSSTTCWAGCPERADGRRPGPPTCMSTTAPSRRWGGSCR